MMEKTARRHTLNFSNARNWPISNERQPELQANSGNGHGNDGNRRRPRDHSPPGGWSARNQRSRYHHQRGDEEHQRRENTNSSLDSLKRLGYGLDPPAWTPKTDRSRPHICLLAVTIDDLPYEHIWQAWANEAVAAAGLDDSVDCVVSLVCHAKYPTRVQSSWLQQRLLVIPKPKTDDGRDTSSADAAASAASRLQYHSRVPEWGSIDIARAMLDCLHDGMQIGNPNGENDSSGSTDDNDCYSPRRFVVRNGRLPNGSKDTESTSAAASTDIIPTVDKFIFISESCLPVATLRECITALFPTSTTLPSLPSFQSDSSPIQGSTTQASSSTAPIDNAAAPVAVASVVKTAESDQVPSTSKSESSAATSSDAAVNAKEECESNGMALVVDPWDVSWVNARNQNTPGTPGNKYELDQFNRIHNSIPALHRWKADQWMILSRRHAAAILHLDEPILQRQQQQSAVFDQRPHGQQNRHHYNSRPLPPSSTTPQLFWTAFTRINASDEIYFPTALSVLCILREGGKESAGNSSATQNGTLEAHSAISEVERRPVTFVDWTEGMRNPATFIHGPRDFDKIAKLARQGGCLLARKFALKGPLEQAPCTGQITVDEWKGILSKLSPLT